MLKIVVTFAVRSEFAPWRRMSNFEPVNGRGVPTYLMRSEDAEVYAIVTGIGKRAVETGLPDLLAESADLCIASGLAGSLRTQYGAGAILVASAVKRSGSGREIKSDESLVKKAQQCGADVVDFFFTSNSVVNAPAEKARLGDVADAVEMESFHIFNLARQHGIPVVAVRAVSDDAETSVPLDFNRIIDDHGRIRWRSSLHEIARSPVRVPGLIRFAFQSSRAARNLAHFLDSYIKSLTVGLDFTHQAPRATLSHWETNVIAGEAETK